ncbi:MAG: polyprenyl synthetase family protein [Kiritimatiellia bacterium]
MADIREYLRSKKALVEAALDKIMPPANEVPEVLHRAMRHSVMAGGKRLRPILCLAAAEAVNPATDAMLPAISLELLHTYSLIHDDLPALDNDDLRRGRPTCHVSFGEANAILAGDALLTLAFELLGIYGKPQLVVELSQAAGSRGMIRGQVEDMLGENQKLGAEQIRSIHLHKTADLIKASLRMGAVAAGAQPKIVDCFSVFGENAGLAFQIMDDVLNETSTPEELGKPVKSDAGRGKSTWCRLFGVEESARQASQLIEEAVAAIRETGLQTGPLEGIARFLVDRKS